MMEERQQLLTAHEAAAYLRVSLFTLNKISRELQPYRTPGGHRRFSVKMLNDYLRRSQKR
ncbi:MAG: helix-turn-helix domain-containing protein [Chloroflexi bacterium]|nr:helix-turn-helix domain-containing protein [Chloroflexota bacterium]